MRKNIILFISLVVIVLIFAFIFLLWNDCNDRGGRLVKGMIFYECVKGA